MIDEKKLEEARGMLAIANDCERTVVERAIALEYAYKGVYRACDMSADISRAEEMLGISDESFVPWSMARSMEALKMMCGSAPDDVVVELKARAIASALFPEVAKGMVSHE